MTELSTSRIEIAVSRLQDGLREHDQPRENAISIATRIVEDGDMRHIGVSLEDDTDFEMEDLDISVDTLRRARKVTEIVEDDLGVDVGHAKFSKAATDLGKLSSIGSVAIAISNLYQASQTLLEEYNENEDPEEMEEDIFDTFAHALSILLVECFLFTTPINYRVAWSGTRHINNRYLYRLREVAPNLHRYVLSEVHYFIRGIIPSTLRSAAHFTDYLVSVSVNTFRTLWEYGEEIGVTEVPDVVRGIVSDFQTFVEKEYDISPPDIDLESVVSEVMSVVTEIDDIGFWSLDDPRMNGNISG